MGIWDAEATPLQLHPARDLCSVRSYVHDSQACVLRAWLGVDTLSGLSVGVSRGLIEAVGDIRWHAACCDTLRCQSPPLWCSCIIFKIQGRAMQPWCIQASWAHSRLARMTPCSGGLRMMGAWSIWTQDQTLSWRVSSLPGASLAVGVCQ